MNDTSPEIEALLKARYAAMTGSERVLIAMQIYGDELARAAFPASES